MDNLKPWTTLSIHYILSLQCCSYLSKQAGVGPSCWYEGKSIDLVVVWTWIQILDTRYVILGSYFTTENHGVIVCKVEPMIPLSQESLWRLGDSVSMQPLT